MQRKCSFGYPACPDPRSHRVRASIKIPGKGSAHTGVPAVGGVSSPQWEESGYKGWRMVCCVGTLVGPVMDAGYFAKRDELPASVADSLRLFALVLATLSLRVYMYAVPTLKLK